jgi:hypothetical protein
VTVALPLFLYKSPTQAPPFLFFADFSHVLRLATDRNKDLLARFSIKKETAKGREVEEEVEWWYL